MAGGWQCEKCNQTFDDCNRRYAGVGPVTCEENEVYSRIPQTFPRIHLLCMSTRLSEDIRKIGFCFVQVFLAHHKRLSHR